MQAAGVLATIAVAIVLVAGLINMLRNGGANLSQRLMRWRVGLQFLAVVVLMLVLYLKQHGGV